MTADACVRASAQWLLTNGTPGTVLAGRISQARPQFDRSRRSLFKNLKSVPEIDLIEYFFPPLLWDAAGSTSPFLVLALAAGHSLSNTSQSGGVAAPNAKILTPQPCSHACERSKDASPEMFGKAMLRFDSCRPAC